MTERAAEIGERYGKILHDLPGHVSTVMFVDGDTFTSISTWDNEQLANAVADTRVGRAACGPATAATSAHRL